MRRRSLSRPLIPLVIATAAFAGTAIATPAAADVDDFDYASWDVVYDVGLDENGRSVTHVTETLIAAFPETDQNKGIVRGLATEYEGASLDTEVLSVRDETGGNVVYELDEDDGLLYVLTGTDDYVYGETTYVIEYELHDVMIAAEDTKSDEFYWNLLPLESTQAIREFSAEIRFDAELSAALTGSAACYEGESGSTTRCTMDGPRTEDGQAIFTVASGERAPGYGATVAIGFDAGTVTQPASRTPNVVTDTVPIALGIGATLASFASFGMVLARQRARRKASGIVVAQYEVPDDLPPLVAGPLVPGSRHAVPAEIVHLAVRGMLRIEQGPSEGSEELAPRLRRLQENSAAPDQLDATAMKALFEGVGADGSLDVPSEDDAFSERMSKLESKGKAALVSRGLAAKERVRSAGFVQWIAIALAVAGLGLSIWGIATGRVSARAGLVVILIATVLVLVGTLLAFTKHQMLTPKGALAAEHLAGVKEFIRVAEADRLRMLQSYTGAERRADGTVDVIHLYERLLPYAILFGHEKEWGSVLESSYASANTTAAWFGSGTDPFLASRILLFSSSMQSASTYTSVSSSAGGSMGGGFSGGGGGGGFSGGR